MLLIFDCDGVLRSVSWDAIHKAYMTIADHIGCDASALWKSTRDFKKWHDSDWHYNLERMGMPLGSDYTETVDIFHGIYDSTIHKFEWVEQVLCHLGKNHELAMLSSAKSASIRASMDESARHFSHIIGLDNVKKIKPDPEGIHLIMEKVGASPESTLMIGDSEADIGAGKNAGTLTAGVIWGMCEREEMASFQPDFLFSEPEELLSLK